jgi:hypothetical protein
MKKHGEGRGTASKPPRTSLKKHHNQACRKNKIKEKKIKKKYDKQVHDKKNI